MLVNMTTSRNAAAARTFTVAAFVAILGWLSVVIGIAALNLTISSWCAVGSSCEQTFWPRLLIAAGGGILGFVISGYALIGELRGRRLLLANLVAVLVTIGTGVWFWPIITG